MIRTAAVVAAVAFSIPAGLAAAQPAADELALAASDESAQAPAATDLAPSAADQAADAEEGAEQHDDEEEYDEEYDEEVEFCGGEESLVDLAYYEMEAGSLESAREMLVTALREGAVEEWQRAHALATLAEVQLRMGQYGPAVLNYRKALRIDAEGVGAAARVGLATALYLRGARERAYEEARGARDELCGDRYSMVACFGAQWIVASASRDAAERQAAAEAMARIRADRQDLAESLDEMEARLAGRRAEEPRS